jgi:hypothetical protein
VLVVGAVLRSPPLELPIGTDESVAVGFMMFDISGRMAWSRWLPVVPRVLAKRNFTRSSSLLVSLLIC